MSEKKALKAIVLAAGKGTRLHSESHDLPKVMREANGRPLISYVLSAIGFIAKTDITIVVGYKKEAVTAAFKGYSFAVQEQQLGTGHAVMSAAENLRGFEGSVLVCCGDMPLIKRETLEALVKTHYDDKNVCTILSGTSDEPLAYGRIVRDCSGDFLKMVEHKDCTDKEREIKELNSGVYMFEAPLLFETLVKLRCDNAQGEYYLTDVPGILKSEGLRVGVCCRHLGPELLGVNTPEQLELVESLLK